MLSEKKLNEYIFDTIKKVEDVMDVKFKKVDIIKNRESSDINTDTKHLRLGISKKLLKTKTSKQKYTIFWILVHESLHLRGFCHNYKGYKIGYYSDGTKDKFTDAVIKLMFGKELI